MSKIENKTTSVLKTTLKRLPLYYLYLEEKKKSGQQYISSTSIAGSLNLNSIQVRKDISSVSTCVGIPNLGFEINKLSEDIASFLGYNNTDEALIVGVGRLGVTLLSYEGFEKYGLNIVLGFDVNKDVTGLKINDKPIFHLSKLKELVARMHINIGIITVPASEAQLVADLLVESGIRAIWNFAPVCIDVPKTVIVRNENLAASLAALSLKLRNEIEKNKKCRSDN